jgi:hypothetical protein
MNATTHEPLNLNSEELAVLAELLESERAELLRTYGARVSASARSSTRIL